MTNLSNYSENAILNAFRGNPFSASVTYIQLHANAPGDSCTANPADWTIRKQVQWTAPTGNGTFANSTDVVFANAPGPETIRYVTIWDAISGGNPLFWAQIAVPYTIAANDTITFAVGSINVTAD